jgi:hypothetical protein
VRALCSAKCYNQATRILLIGSWLN